MTPPATGLSYQTFTDDRLLDLLLTEEDRLPRAAVDEFIARGERMIEPLTRILESREAWHEDGAGFWRPVHAAYILGAIGGEKAVAGLISALRFSMDTDMDWVSEELPSMFAAIGSPAIWPLLCHSREANRESYERWKTFSALAAIAARFAERRDEILDFLRAVADDDREPDLARTAAADELLPFARPGDRDTLFRAADLAESDPVPLFDRSCVQDAYKGSFPLPNMRALGWLDFYSPEAIEARQKRWREDDESESDPSVDRDSDPGDDGIRAFLDPQTVEPELGPITSPIRVGRNEPCPCGSGKKYKRCCEE